VTQESNPNHVKIGELLIAVGVMTTGDLTEAIQISKRMGVPIGRVLVMSGCVTEADLQSALELQSLVKDNLVDLETGIKALEMVFKEKMDLKAALKTFNWSPNKDSTGNKLGDLLIDSSIVSRGQLERALEASFQSGMPLGGTLVLQGVLSPMLLPTVLHTQEQIRDGKMTRDDAVEELKRALMFWAKAGKSKDEELQSGFFAKSGAPSSDFGTPEPMPAPMPPAAPAPAPAPAPAFHANQYAPANPPPIPAAPPAPAQQPLSPVEMAMAPYGATAGSAAGKEKIGDTLESEVRPPQPPPAQPNVVSLVELLKLSGFCTQATIDQSIQQALVDPRLASKLLLAIGFIDGDTLNTYIRCQAMIARGVLRTDQVLYVLNSMRHRKIDFDQAVKELGIELPA
jgi:hypothetical protein